MIAKVADFFEGFQIGKAEIGKQTVETPQGTGRLNAVKYDQDEIALEGLDMPMPQGQLKMERFALKSFRAANLMRWAASLRTSGQPPSPDQMLGLFGVLEGAEIKGVVAPYKATRQLFTIDTISLSWGQLVGSIPSKANLVVKMVTPTDPANPALQPLIMAGVDKLAIDLDLGAAWTESSGAFALSPATIDLGNLAKAQARFALANVPRGLFTIDPAQAMGQAAQVETGAFEALAARQRRGRSRRGAIRAYAECQPRCRAQRHRRDDQGTGREDRGGQRRCRGRGGCARRLRRDVGADADHQADAARQGAADAIDAALAKRPRERAGAVQDRGVDGVVENERSSLLVIAMWRKRTRHRM
ncbi:hypothetical protein ACVOMS_04475 [Bradyrhizobium guangxiense]